MTEFKNNGIGIMIVHGWFQIVKTPEGGYRVEFHSYDGKAIASTRIAECGTEQGACMIRERLSDALDLRNYSTL